MLSDKSKPKTLVFSNDKYRHASPHEARKDMFCKTMENFSKKNDASMQDYNIIQKIGIVMKE